MIYVEAMQIYILFILVYLEHLWNVSNAYSAFGLFDDGDFDESDQFEESNDDQEDFNKDIDLKLHHKVLSEFGGHYELVYPRQYHKGDFLPSLSTLENVDSKSHFSHTSFVFPLEGQNRKIRVMQNRDIFAEGLKVKRHLDLENAIIEQWLVENCVYRGEVRHLSDSHVALSTCNGLRGVIAIGNTTYFIEPLSPRNASNQVIRPHVLYKEQRSSRKTCGNTEGMWSPYQELHMSEFLRQVKIMKTHPDDVKFISITEQHLELGLVFDNTMFVEHSEDIDELLLYAFQLTNIASMTFAQHNVSLHLIFVEIWNLGSKVSAAGATEKQFLEDVLQYHRASGKHRPDVTVYVTGEKFASANHVAGLAVPDSVCSDRAVAVFTTAQSTQQQQQQQRTQPSDSQPRARRAANRNREPSNRNQQTTRPQPNLSSSSPMRQKASTAPELFDEKHTDDIYEYYSGDDAYIASGDGVAESADSSLYIVEAEEETGQKAAEMLPLGGAAELVFSAHALSHLTAHVLGVRHDDERACDCDSPGSCLLQDNYMRSVASGFPSPLTSCGVKDLNGSILVGLAACLQGNSEQSRFATRCGNGVVERGEQCDCGSSEDCRQTAPCCNPDTCLWRAWATCSEGECCFNCTVLSAETLCRVPESDCDVPEFCNGMDGQCPADQRVQDGRECLQQEGYCYAGQCHTLDAQCKDIWGPGARASEDTCYSRFNEHGNFNGHCGYNTTAGSYRECQPRDVKCGLLHCVGGRDRPLYSEKKTFSTTSVVSDGHQYQCKILNDVLETRAPVGLAQDGTRCGAGKLCVNTRCVPVDSVKTAACPSGANGLECSGNGVCTNTSVCYCFLAYSGADCSIQGSVPSLRHQPTTAPPPAPTPPGNGSIPGGVMYTEGTTRRAGLQMSTPATAQEGPSWTSTLGLSLVLAAVAIVSMILFTCCMFCYRRKSPARLKKPKTKSKKEKLFSLNKKFSGSEIMFCDTRAIKFGNLPSYKKDKQKHLATSSRGAPSETGSDHSGHVDKESVGSDVRSSRPLPPATNMPDRGILKRGSSGAPRRGASQSVRDVSATTTQSARSDTRDARKRGRSLENIKALSSRFAPQSLNLSAAAGYPGVKATAELQPLCSQSEVGGSGNKDMRNSFVPPKNIYMGSYFGSKGKPIFSNNSVLMPVKDSLEYRHQLQRQLQCQEPHYSFFATTAASPLFLRPMQSVPSPPSHDHPHFPPAPCPPTQHYSTDPQRPESGDYMHLTGLVGPGPPTMYDRIENAPDFDAGSVCTCSSDGKGPTGNNCASDLSDLSDLENAEGVQSSANESKDVETQTDSVLTPDSTRSESFPRDDSNDSLKDTQKRINKLKNINVLLKEIDEQFNSVLRQTQQDLTSPASSEETHCSEPEADRQFGESYHADNPPDNQSAFPATLDSNRSSYITTDYEDRDQPSRVSSSLLSSPDASPRRAEGAEASSLNPLETLPLLDRGASRPSEYIQKTSTPKEGRHTPPSQRFQLSIPRTPFSVSSTSAFSRLPTRFNKKTDSAPEQVSHHIEQQNAAQCVSRDVFPDSQTPPVCQSSPKRPLPHGSPVPSPRKVSLKLSSQQQSPNRSNNSRSQLSDPNSLDQTHKHRSQTNERVSPNRHPKSPTNSPTRKSNIPRATSGASKSSRQLDYSSPNVSLSRAENQTVIPYSCSKNTSMNSLNQGSSGQKSPVASKRVPGKKPQPPPRNFHIKRN